MVPIEVDRASRLWVGCVAHADGHLHPLSDRQNPLFLRAIPPTYVCYFIAFQLQWKIRNDYIWAFQEADRKVR